MLVRYSRAMLACSLGALALAGSASADAWVDIENWGYRDTEIEVDAGEAIHFANDADVAHSVTSDEGLFDSGPIPPGGGFSVTLSVPGTHVFRSTADPGFVGRIVVPVVGLPGAPGDLANDRVPAIPFPAPEADDIEVHPTLAVPASKTRLLIGWTDTATVAEANAALELARVEIVGGLPATGILLGEVEQSWCCWGEGGFGFGESAWENGSFDLSSFTNLENALETLRASPGVDFAALDLGGSTRAVPPRPNAKAEGSGSGWSWDDAAGAGNWWIPAARFDAAWNLIESVERTGSTDIVTAVADAGFEAHEDLPGLEIVTQVCASPTSCLDVPNSSDDHGNHVAGTIGAAFDNADSAAPGRSVGVSGGNPFAKLKGYSFDSFTASRPGLGGAVHILDGELQLFEALFRNPPSGLRVLNYSAGIVTFGSGSDLFQDSAGDPIWWKANPEPTCGPGANDDDLPEIVTGTKEFCTPNNHDGWLHELGQVGRATARVAKLAASAGILIVPAAGNESNDFCPPAAPAPGSSACTMPLRGENAAEFGWVGAHWDELATAGLPNPILLVESVDRSGARSAFSNTGDIAAFGGDDVLSTTVGDSYDDKIGTSMAAPQVSAAAGFLLAQEPGLGLADLRERLLAWGAPENEMGPHANLFEWRVPDRLGHDRDGNRVIDYPSQHEVVPSDFRAELDACGTVPDARRFVWTVDGTQVATTSKCRYTHVFPAEGDYSVGLTATAPGQTPRSDTRTVSIEDLLIVSIGDSIASGEGNPAVPKPGWLTAATWQERRCHRSALAGPAKTARWLEAADVRSSVTFLHLACSGGRMTGDLDASGSPLPGNAGVGGLLTPYEGIEPPDSTCENDRLHPTACLPPQLAEVKRQLGERTPDALLISIGANDMQFSTIVKDCIVPLNDCSAAGNDGRDTFDGRIGLLAPRYDLLARRIALAFPSLPADRVFITEYPDPTHDGTGAVDMSCLPVTQVEADWAATTVVTGLNAQVRAAAAAHGWTAVTGIGADFATHGYCAADSWFVRLTESVGGQGDIEGSFHPNGKGQNAYAERIVAAVRGKLGLSAVTPTQPAGDVTPRLDVYSAALAADGALKALVDVNDPSDDGNRRVVYEPDGNGGMTETPDELSSREPGRLTAPDGYVDMRDFRRFRDAWLARCIEDDTDSACPADSVGDISLDGADDHVKKDGNLDGCVWRAGDPAGCGASETDHSRFDLNGDGKLSVDSLAVVPLDGQGRPTADPAAATEHDDLSVLSSRWNLNPKTADGWGPDDLRDLLRSADIEVHADEIFAEGARTADVQIRLKGGADVGPLRRIRKSDPSATITIPVTAGDEFEVVARADSPNGTMESISDPFPLLYGEDRRVDLCPGLTLKASPNRVPADGKSTSTITATLHKCKAGNDVAGLPISFTLDPASAGTLDLTPSVTDANGKAEARFRAGTTDTTTTVRAEVELPSGDTLDAEVEIRTVEELTIKYVWRQFVENWSESGSTRWTAADPRQPDCTLAGVEYCIDSFALALTGQTGQGMERHGTLTGGGNRFTLTEQVLNSTTRSSGTWALTHSDGRIETGGRDATWFVTDPQAYTDHELTGVAVEDEPDAVRVSGMQKVGDLPYHYALLGTPTGETAPIEIGAAKTSLLLIPQGGAPPIRFAAHPERDLAFPRRPDGTLEPYTSCFTLDEDITPEPGYLVLGSTDGYVPGALSIGRKPDYVGGDRPMPVGPAHMKVRYAFAAVAYYAGSGAPAPTPVLPDCTVNNPPTAAFEFTPPAPDEGRQVAFRDKSTDLENDIKSWAWDFGDGKTASGPNPYHLFEDDGAYTVTLTVTDRDGATAQATRQVTVANLPPEASIDDAAAQEGQPLTLTYRVLDPGSIDKKSLRVRIVSSNPVWPRLDETAPANVYTLTYLNLPAGTYPLRLTVTDKDGATAVADAVVSVTATPPPPPPPPPTTTFPTCNPVVVLDAEEQAFLDRVNEYREDNGLAPVAVSPALTRAADVHARDMAAHDYMEHTGRDGSSPADRAWREGYPKTASVGENLATAARTGADALWAWRSSTTGHNENMLNPAWVAVGIARAQGGEWRWATSYGTELDCGVTAPAAASAAEPEGDEQPFAPTPTGDGAEPASAEPVRVLGPGGESPVLTHEPLDAALEAEPESAEIAAAAEAAELFYPPTSAFTISDVEPRENQPVTISNRSRDATGASIPATFDPDDSTGALELAADESRVHRFQQPYSRYLRLSSTDAAGRSSELERWIWVDPKPTAYVFYTGSNTGFVGKTAELSAEVIDPTEWLPVAGVEVTFTVDDSRTFTATTNAVGRASVTLPLTGFAPGWYSIRADFAGSELLNGSGTWGSLEVIRNELPVAHAGGPYVAGEGGSLLLSGLKSRDADDGIASYEWDLDADGAYDDATGRLPAVQEWDQILALICSGTCATGHDYPIALRVTDTRGDSATASTTVRFTPDFDILLGGEGKTIVPGQSNSFAVTLIGSASWNEPVTLSVSGLPAGVSASFSRNPITPTAVSVLTITGEAGLEDGTFPIRVTATGGGVTKEVSDEVEVAFGLIPICYGAVTGVVTDRTTGLPLGGATVYLDGYLTAVTDPSGRYAFEQVSLGFNNAARSPYLYSSAGGYWASESKTGEVACGSVARVDLTQLAIGKGVITGTIVDKETKQPIPGASINQSVCNWWSCFWTSFAPVDELGAFTGEVELGDQNQGRWYSLRADAPGYWYEDEVARVEADAPGVIYSELIRKCSATLVGGSVTWQDSGEPAVGIGIGIYLSGGWRPDLALVTDENGIFTINRSLELGHRNTPRWIDMQIGVAYPMSPQIVDPLELAECDGTDSARIVITRPVPNYGDVDGYVTDEETGAPLAGQWVSMGNRGAQTDAAGYYRIDDILLGHDSQKTGWVGVSTARSGYHDASASAIAEADKVTRIDLKLLKRRFGSVSGAVTDSVTGAPIPSASVSDGCFWWSSLICAWTNREGRYSRTGIGLAARNGPVGGWVTASADGYWPQAKWVSVSADTNTVTDFQLQPECAPAAIRGTVVNAETQAPLQGAQVSGGGNYPSYTDANGRFEILGIRPSTGNNPRQVWLTASAAGFYSQTKQITIFCGANITVTFGSRTSKTGTIVGRVTDGDTGLPLANTFLGSDFGATATTDANGEYRIADVPLGDLNSEREWNVLAQPPGYKTQTRTVTVRADQESRLDFVFASANQPPSANGQSVALDEDTNIAIATTGADPDGDTLTHHVLRYPAHGTLSGRLPNVTYYPDANYSGPDSFEFVVNDGVANSERATVTIDVRGLNDQPIAFDDQLDASVDVPLRVPAATLLANDRDVDVTDELRISAVTLWGSQGEVRLEGDEVVFTPPPGWENPIYYAFFTYTATDGRGGYDTALVYVRVTEAPLAPTCAPRSFAVEQDQAFSGALACTDPNGDVLTYELVAGPADGTLTLRPDGMFDYSPPAGFVGTTTFTYRAGDGDLNSGVATATLVVAPANEPPSASGDHYEVDEDATLTLAAPGVLANDTDPDADALTAQLAAGPAHGSLTLAADGSLTYTPAAGFNGTDSFSYRASDGALTSADASVTITIRPVNDPPAAAPDAYALDEDTQLTVAAPGLLANDADGDGDALTAEIVSGPAHGVAVVLADGSLLYTPEPDYHGPDALTYRALDGAAASQPATVTLTVRPVNDRPTAENVMTATDEDTPVAIDLGGNDVDGGPLTTAAGMPQHGTFVNGVYAPAPDFHGTDTFAYTVTDPDGASATAAVTVVVRPLNDGPAAADVVSVTDEDVPVAIALAGTDRDGETPAVAPLTAPEHGTFADGVYTPDVDYHGSDGFRFLVTDGAGATDVGTVTITVRPVNDAPEATDAAAATDEDVPVPIALTGTDVDDDTLTVAPLTPPEHGTYADGVYTPEPDYYGNDGFRFVVTDGAGATDVGTVTITVRPVNDAPAAADVTAATDEDTAVAIDLAGTDPDGDPLTLTHTAPAHGSYSAGVYTPAPDYHGTDSFAYTVTDPSGAAATATVTITVRPVNDAPAAADDTAATDEDTPLSIPVGVLLANDADVDGDALRVVSVDGSASTNGSVTLADGIVRFVPDPDVNGPARFDYVVGDGAGGTDRARVTVDVAPVNDPPRVTLAPIAPVDEGAAPVTLTSTATDVDGDTLSYAWFTDVGTVVASGPSAQFSSDDGPALATVGVLVADGSVIAGATQPVEVRNVAPLVAAGADIAGPWGVPLAFGGTVSDPSTADTAAGLSPTWAFGDGGSAAGLAATHAYAAPGAYTAILSARDKDGGSGSDVAAVAVAKRATRLEYTGPSTGVFGFTAVAARLVDLADGPTSRLAGRTVQFTIAGETVAAVTDASGTATATAPHAIMPGAHAVSAQFAEDSLYLSSSASAQVTVGSGSGKITGGGLRSLAHPGRGGFNVHSAGKGELQWQNGATNFHAPDVTALGVSPDGRSAWFAGTGRDGRPYVAYVEDNGEPGTADVFKLWIGGVLQTPGDGRLAGGNIQIHKS